MGILAVEFQPSNIVEHDGVAIAIIGMFIVFFALSLISLFIAQLPTMLAFLNEYLPPEPEPYVSPIRAPRTVEPADEEVAVAIGMAIHFNRVPGAAVKRTNTP